jgi:hypothetical protein
MNRQAAVTLSLIAVTWAVLAGLMFFNRGSGEHDAFMMAAAVVHGLQIGRAMNYLNYGSDLQFAFYYGFHSLGQLVPLDGDAVLLVMNVVGTASALAIPILLFFLVRADCAATRLSPSAAALLLVSSPVYAFLVPYGHPFHIAFATSLVSWLVFRRFALQLPVARRYGLFGAAVLLQAVALTIRAEQVFLFWFCMFGLFLYEREKSKERWVSLFALYAASAAAFLVAHHFLVPKADEVDSAVVTGAPGFLDVVRRLFSVVLEIYLSNDIVRSLAYHVTDIGLPLISVATFFLFKHLLEKNIRPVIAFAVSIGPSMIVYLANPSPPRHFAITAIAIALFVAASVRRIGNVRIAGIAAVFLVLNILVPPMLNVLDPGSGVESRRTVTYSFFERYRRNKEEIRAATEFLPRMWSQLPPDTVVFGQWVHIAQLSMLMSHDPDLRFESTELAPSIHAFAVTYQGRNAYLIEAYDDDQIRPMVEQVRAAHPTLRFFSLVSDHPVDVLDIPIPSELLWWSI